MPLGTSSVAPGLEFDRRIDAGAQVQAGGTGSRIVRQIVPEARIEDFDVEFVHGWYLQSGVEGCEARRARRALGSSRPFARCYSFGSSRGDVGDEGARELDLWRARKLVPTGVVEQDQLVVVARRKRAGRDWRRAAASSCAGAWLRHRPPGSPSRRQNRRRTALSCAPPPCREYPGLGCELQRHVAGCPSSACAPSASLGR